MKGRLLAALIRITGLPVDRGDLRKALAGAGRRLMAVRPRNPAANAAIMTAALALLCERGYAGLTLDDVAHRADIGKSSLYRRFRDRADLATAAIASVRRELPPPAGDLRADLIAYLRAVDADLDAAMELLIGSLVNRAPAGGRSQQPWPERAVDTILSGLGRPGNRRCDSQAMRGLPGHAGMRILRVPEVCNPLELVRRCQLEEGMMVGHAQLPGPSGDQRVQKSCLVRNPWTPHAALALAGS